MRIKGIDRVLYIGVIKVFIIRERALIYSLIISLLISHCMSESNDEVKLIEERVKLFKLKANEIQYQFTSKDLYKTLG